jgi:hypothetical protein
MTVVIAPLFPIQFGPKFGAKPVHIYHCHLLASEPPNPSHYIHELADSHRWTASLLLCSLYRVLGTKLTIHQAPAFVKNFGWGQLGLAFWP